MQGLRQTHFGAQKIHLGQHPLTGKDLLRVRSQLIRDGRQDTHAFAPFRTL